MVSEVSVYRGLSSLLWTQDEAACHDITALCKKAAHLMVARKQS